jgi:hypothetical protein
MILHLQEELDDMEHVWITMIFYCLPFYIELESWL